MPADSVTAQFNNTARYESMMEVVRNRMTNRAFAPWDIPRQHFEMILEAARHAPSGANAQPWHYIVVTDPEVKQTIGQCFVDEQQHRARLRMGFPTPNYNGVKTAPGLIVIVADFRRPPGRGRPRLCRLVDHRHRAGGHPEADQAAARGAGRAGRDRRDVLRAAAQTLLQAMEEGARPDHELGPVPRG